MTKNNDKKTGFSVGIFRPKYHDHQELDEAEMDELRAVEDEERELERGH